MLKSCLMNIIKLYGNNIPNNTSTQDVLYVLLDGFPLTRDLSRCSSVTLATIQKINVNVHRVIIDYMYKTLRFKRSCNN